MEGIFTGKTIDEAKQAAAQSFGVEESKISFEIIEEPKKGIFGRIKGEAKINAVYNPTRTEISVEYVKKILDNMKLVCDINVVEKDECTEINIEGDDVGAIIGRRGETLDAIQYLVAMVANKGTHDYHRIVLDSGGYREKRENTLIDLATKISKSVLKKGYSSALEPMNPYERRIIHSTVSEIEGVYSRSIGEEPFRKVIIYPVNKRPDRPRSEKRNSSPKNVEGPRSLDLKTSFEKDYKKPNPDKDIGSGLYGKIDI